MDAKEVRVIEAHQALAQLRERNAAGAVRGRVLKVLDLEIPQLRGYLDRAEPNVRDAIARLRLLEDFAEQLRNER